MMVPRYPEDDFLAVDKLTYAGNRMSLRPVESLPNFRFERLDIVDGDAVNRVIREFKPDRVYHFAAETHVDRSILDPGLFVQANVIGTFNLLEACRKTWESFDGKVFHHVSTDEVYGTLGDTGLFTEDTRYDPTSPYAASKASSDHIVRAYHHTYGFPSKITNCSNNFGPCQFPEKLIPLMISNAVDGKPLPVYGTGEAVRDWLYVGDHCEAIRLVAERGRVGETYNIGASCEKTALEMVKKICAAVAAETGRDVAEYEKLITFVPDRPGHDMRYAIDASKVRNELGWAPQVGFEEGLRQTVHWYLTNKEWVDAVKSGEYREWLERNYEKREDWVGVTAERRG
jgi:dTDP-glucose 4,6-dehydratase